MAVSRVIEVSFGRSSVALVRIDTAYFYNNGILFKPTDIDLPASYQVHWADSPQASSTLETIGTAEGAPIPDDLWNRSRVIYGWIYLHPTEDSAVTAYEVRIYKNVRAGLPDGTEPTPEEQSVIDQAISALNTAVAKTAQDVISADQSARSAESAKTAAESARDTAGEYANDAQSSAESASESARVATEKATASAESASQSAQIKSDIEGMVDDAQSYAESALIASQASVTARDTAQGYANSASASAQSASGYASNAQTSANTASSKATEASTSAQTASTKATEASQSAENALSYKTDAESAKTASQTAQGLAESARDSAISAKNDAESARDEAQNIVDGISAKASQIDANTASIASLTKDKAPVITDTASGAIASFTDGADNLPLKSLVIDINPVQDLSQGDPSPENICPISGWTEVWVEQSGENVGRIYAYSANGLLTPQTTPVVSNSYGTTISTTDSQANKIVVTQTRHDGATYGSYLNGFFVVGIGNIINGQRYYFRAKINVTSNPLNTERLLAFWNGSGNSTPLTIANGYVTGTFVASISDEQRYLEIRCAGASFEMSEIMFMLAEDMPSPYSPYTGRSITIDLGQTVYGGKLDVLSGELTVDRAMVDLGTLNWEYQSNYERFRANLSDVKTVATPTDVANILCAQYATTYMHDTRYSIIGRNAIVAIGNDQNRYVYLVDVAYDNAVDFKNAMNGVQLVYELATPIEIQLSANQLNSLLGANNIWADSGDAEVEYRADTKLFIERLTAPDSADMVADANITSGQYFMVGNSLYKATANIANGSAIVVGTNCIRKSLSEALNEINA